MSPVWRVALLPRRAGPCRNRRPSLGRDAWSHSPEALNPRTPTPEPLTPETFPEHAP